MHPACRLRQVHIGYRWGEISTRQWCRGHNGRQGGGGFDVVVDVSSGSSRRVRWSTQQQQEGATATAAAEVANMIATTDNGDNRHPVRTTLHQHTGRHSFDIITGSNDACWWMAPTKRTPPPPPAGAPDGFCARLRDKRRGRTCNNVLLCSYSRYLQEDPRPTRGICGSCV